MKLERQKLLESLSDYECFIKNFSLIIKNQRLSVLTENSCEIFRAIYQKYNANQLRTILSVIPEGDNQDLIRVVRTHYVENPNKSSHVLGMLLMNSDEEIFKDPQNAQLSSLIPTNDFRTVIQGLSKDLLPFILFIVTEGRNEPQHALWNILRLQGSEVFSETLDLLEDEELALLKAELFRIVGRAQLYKSLIEKPGKHQVKIINLIKTELDDEKKTALILEKAKILDLESILALFESMSERVALVLLTTRMLTEPRMILLDYIAKKTEKNTYDFMRFLHVFKNPDNRFKLYSLQFNFRAKLVHASNRILNPVMTGIGSIVLKLFGPMAGGYIESIQKEEDIPGLLINQLLLQNQHLYEILPHILSELYPKQVTILLRSESFQRFSLLFYVVTECSIDSIIDILSGCAFHTPDNEKLFVIDQVWMDLLSLSELKPGVSGLLAFVNLYNYLAVRSMEAGGENYQDSCDEFARMLLTLFKNSAENDLSTVLKLYCEENPLRQAHTLKLATSSIKLGTNRHLDARDLLLKLPSEELKFGLEYFHRFIQMRDENYHRITSQLSCFLRFSAVLDTEMIYPEMNEISMETNMHRVHEIKATLSTRSSPAQEMLLGCLDRYIACRLNHDDFFLSRDLNNRVLDLMRTEDLDNRSSMSLL